MEVEVLSPPSPPSSPLLLPFQNSDIFMDDIPSLPNPIPYTLGETSFFYSSKMKINDLYIA